MILNATKTILHFLDFFPKSRESNSSNDLVGQHYYSALDRGHESPGVNQDRGLQSFVALFSACRDGEKKRAWGECKSMQMWWKVGQIGVPRAYVQFSQDFSEKNPDTPKDCEFIDRIIP